MIDKRAKGRPARGADEVGRDKIIDAMRAVMRIDGRATISRKDLAAFAGITPALVSYYFSNRPSLIAAAAIPVVQEYDRAVQGLAATDEASDSKLLKLISILIDCYGRDGGIIESFREFMTSSEAIGVPDYTASMQRSSLGIVETWLETNPACRWNADFVHRIVWGICKAVAPRPQSHTGRAQEAITGRPLCTETADHVMRLLTCGLVPGSDGAVQHVVKRHIRNRDKRQSETYAGSGSLPQLPSRAGNAEGCAH